MFLTKPEVRKDIREIQRTLNVDSDSEGSVMSEDVLDCRNDYPVKPRKIPRWGSGAGAHTHAHGAESPRVDDAGGSSEQRYYDVQVVESTMQSLKTIQSTKPELWEAELERERLDILRQAVQHSLLSESKRVNSMRKEQESYFRALQGAHMRGLLLQNAHARQNAMTWDVLTALKRRKSGAALLDSEIQRLKTLYSNAKPIRSTAKNKDGRVNGKATTEAQPDPASTSVLRVSLAGTTKEITLYRGQHLETPMGVAVVIQIIPIEEKVVLKLPFGLMYAHMRRVLCWGVSASQDDANAIDRKATFADTLDSAADKTLACKWKALRYAITLPAECSRGVASVLGTLTDAEQAANVAAAAEGAPDEIAPSAEAAAADAHDPEEADPENDNRLLFSISQGSAGGVDLMQQYHLPVVQDSLHLRSNMLANVHEAAGYSIRDPRLVMGPPQALVHMITEKLTQKKRELHLCPLALGGNTATQIGVTGSMTWDANTDSMRKNLHEKTQVMQQLEGELQRSLSEISAARRRAARLAVETSALRMNMFTRRVRHRNNLSDRGLLNPSGLSGLIPSSIGGEPTAHAAGHASTDDLTSLNQEGGKAHKGQRGFSRGDKGSSIAAPSQEADGERREGKRSRSALGNVEDANDSDSDNEDEDEMRQIGMPHALMDAEALAGNPKGEVFGAEAEPVAVAVAVEKTEKEEPVKEKPKGKRKRAA